MLLGQDLLRHGHGLLVRVRDPRRLQARLIFADAPAGAEFALCVGVVITGATLSARASRLRREQAALYERLQQREAQLREVNHRLGEESRRDPLTGVANRLRLEEDLVELSARTERHGGSYCLVLCDLARFKDYNDALGHQAGDDALRTSRRSSTTRPAPANASTATAARNA